MERPRPLPPWPCVGSCVACETALIVIRVGSAGRRNGFGGAIGPQRAARRTYFRLTVVFGVASSALAAPGQGKGLFDVVSNRYLLRLIVRKEVQVRYRTRPVRAPPFRYPPPRPPL